MIKIFWIFSIDLTRICSEKDYYYPITWWKNSKIVAKMKTFDNFIGSPDLAKSVVPVHIYSLYLTSKSADVGVGSGFGKS